MVCSYCAQAFHLAESKLIQSEKKHADNVIQTSSSKDVEKLSNMVAGLKKNKVSLEAALQAERCDYSTLKRQLADSLKETSDMKNTVGPRSSSQYAV